MAVQEILGIVELTLHLVVYLPLKVVVTEDIILALLQQPLVDQVVVQIIMEILLLVLQHKLDKVVILEHMVLDLQVVEEILVHRTVTLRVLEEEVVQVD